MLDALSIMYVFEWDRRVDRRKEEEIHSKDEGGGGGAWRTKEEELRGFLF